MEWLASSFGSMAAACGHLGNEGPSRWALSLPLSVSQPLPLLSKNHQIQKVLGESALFRAGDALTEGRCWSAGAWEPTQPLGHSGEAEGFRDGPQKPGHGPAGSAAHTSSRSLRGTRPEPVSLSPHLCSLPAHPEGLLPARVGTHSSFSGHRLGGHRHTAALRPLGSHRCTPQAQEAGFPPAFSPL